MSEVSLTGWMKALIAYVRSGEPDLTNRQMALLMLVYLTPGPHTVRGAQLDHGARQLAGLRLGVGERAGTDLHVEHQRASPLGQFLAHHRAGDQGERLDGGGDQGVRS